MKITQSNVGIILISFLVGAGLTLAGVGLFRQTQPAPIAIIPPAPTATPPPTATAGPIRVYVNGAVTESAVYTLPPDSIVAAAIEAAGGFSGEANQAVVNLAQPLFDGAQVYVPTFVEVAATPTAVINTQPAQTNSPAAAATGGLVNINQANAAELDSLPGVGPSTAAAIIEYRNTEGLFQTIEEIMNVPGIGEAKFAQVKDLITVGDS